MAKSPISLLYGDESNANDKDASAFISTLMHAVTAIHMHHIMVTGAGSYAKHNALGVYSDLQSATDGLAEAFIGCTDMALSFPAAEFTMQADPVAEVQKIYDYVETNRAMMGDESHIQNEVDGICTLLASALYKLKRLS